MTLPNPKSRKEQYLAKAAGMSTTIPEKPESREEQYLEAIANNGGGGGGGGTKDFDQLDNRPKYKNITMDSTTNIPEVKTYTAGTNITIDTSNKISATDTTYSDFVGTDGTVAGSAGLVPAPATTDAGKFLKADGTWDTVGGGGGPTVVQTTGTSTTDVMSQNATTSMVFADPSTRQQIRLGSGANVNGVGGVAIGLNSYTGTARGQIALGATSGISSSRTAQAGVFSVQAGNTFQGYNNTTYRLLEGLYDGQSDHDAATYGQLISYSAINGSSAPTTSTEGKYVGQLYYDTTNEQMYYLKTIDTTTTPATYTWESLGGGSGPTVVQTTGTSPTDVMSQDATTSMVYGANDLSKIKIGYNATTTGNYTVALGRAAEAVGDQSVALGLNSKAKANFSTNLGAWTGNSNDTAYQFTTALGYNAIATGGVGSVAIGAYSKANSAGEMNIGLFGSGAGNGYNNSNYRLLTGLYDGQSAHDAATLAQGNTLSSTAPTSSTEGVLGQLYTDTTNMHTYQCTAIDTTDPSNPVYTWTQRW